MNLVTQPNDFLVTVAFLALLTLILIPTIFMWVSLAKQGDERKRMILTSTCTNTLVLYTVTLLIDVIGSWFNADFFDPLSSDLTHLGVIGVLFSINLFFTKKKFGG